LNLNFARARALDPRITFTRASVGTYFGRDGLIKTAGNDEPRFDHDPVTLESLGLLIEESRTNYATYSEDFTTSWATAAIGSVTSNSTTSPDGNNNGTLLVNTGPSPITVNGQTVYYGGQIYKGTHGPDTGSHTWSLFAKAKECEIIAPIANTNGGSKQAFFDLSNGTIFFAPSDTTCVIEPYPNGWYKCSITWNQGSSVSYTYNIQVFSKTEITGSDGIYIWGAQLEKGAFPTSYIPTSASYVTRTPDYGYLTGENFSSWFNQTEGSLDVGYKLGYDNVSMRVCQISNQNANTAIDLVVGSGAGNGGYWYIITGGSAQFSATAVFNANQVGLNRNFRSVLAYKENDCAAQQDKVSTISTDTTSVTLATDYDRLLFYQIANGGDHIQGHLKYIRYYPKRITNAQVTQLSQDGNV
jgi:hypothetical protein